MHSRYAARKRLPEGPVQARRQVYTRTPGLPRQLSVVFHFIQVYFVVFVHLL